VTYKQLLHKAQDLSQTHWTLMNKKNENFSELVSVYRQKGSFRKQQLRSNTVATDLVKLAKPSAPKEAQDDLNPEAPLLTANLPLRAKVQVGVYTYYKFNCSLTDGRVVLEVRDKAGGDVDLVVGNYSTPRPTDAACSWRMSRKAEASAFAAFEQLTIHTFDRDYVKGFFYVGVRGVQRSGGHHAHPTQVESPAAVSASQAHVAFSLSVTLKKRSRTSGRGSLDGHDLSTVYESEADGAVDVRGDGGEDVADARGAGDRSVGSGEWEVSGAGGATMKDGEVPTGHGQGAVQG
jgi:hypothetical protein